MVAEPSTLPKPKILAVDDDPALLTLLETILTHEGYEVELAADGASALAAVDHQHPDVILLDLMMPEMDGFSFVEALAASPAWAGVPVIVLTARELSAEERLRLQGHVSQVLQKGALNREELAREIRRGLTVAQDVVGAWSELITDLPELTRAKDVTIRHLLSMTSGYQDFWPQDYVMPMMLEPVVPQQVFDRWARIPLDFEPGTKYQYSNTNYLIAGVIAVSRNSPKIAVRTLTLHSARSRYVEVFHGFFSK